MHRTTALSNPQRPARKRWLAAGIPLLASAAVAADFGPVVPPRAMSELVPQATLHLGKTADWVVVTADAVWVGSTGPNAVHRIDPATNREVATVLLDGEPCAGITAGFKSLWVPLCATQTAPATLARIDLASDTVTAVFRTGPAAAEGGIAAGGDSIWIVLDKNGQLARIDPQNGDIRQVVRVPPGSYNPHYSDGQVWVTRADGAEVTSVDAATGKVTTTVASGPGPRFLTSGNGRIWTLNQGDGSLTRIDAGGAAPVKTVALGTPGHGGDIAFGGGLVWTTMPKIPLTTIDAATATVKCQWAGPGGDSLGIGHGSIWLTDYDAGTVSRIDLARAQSLCDRKPGT